MGFILTAANGEDTYINAWNWRPTLLFLFEQGIIDQEQHEMLGMQLGREVDAETSVRIADAIAAKLADMKPGTRMRADLSIADDFAPPPLSSPLKWLQWRMNPRKSQRKLLVFTPTGTNGVSDEDAYSATYEWWVEFESFSRRSGGFSVG